MPRGVATKATSCRSASSTGSEIDPLPRPLSGASSAMPVGPFPRALAGLRFQRHDLRQQRALQVAEVERLLDEVVGPQVQRLQGHVVVRMAADHDDGGRGNLLLELL